MISEKMKSGTVSLPKKLLKMVCGTVVPFLWVAAVVSTILCCFKSAEGSNSRTICLIVAIVSYGIIFVTKTLNKKFTEKDPSYRVYQSQVSKKLDLPHLVPLLALTVVIAFPFYLLIVTSMKNPIEANAFEFTWWPTEGIDLDSYVEMFNLEGAIGVTLLRTILNSFIYAIVPGVVGLFSSAVAAYAFSKLKFKGRDALYRILIATMMMPGCVTMASSYLMFDYVYGWTNTPLPLIVPGLFGAAACVMFLREYFMGIPDGLLEAARIDGAGKVRSFFHIMLPLAKPALIAQFILRFISAYNDYMGPLIYLNDPTGYTIQVALDFLNGAVIDNTLVASACVFALVPMLLLYIIFQKPILNGISISSGLKG